MIDVYSFSGKKLAVILIDYSERNDGDWFVVGGYAKVKDGRLYVDRGTDTDFPFPEDTYDRIKAVTSELTPIIGDAEFVTTLTIGPVSDVKSPNQSPEPTP
jgi:hypothetical protein